MKLLRKAPLAPRWSMTADKTIDLLRSSVEMMLSSPLRNGQLLHFPAAGELLATGDLHSHHRNFQRICHFADMDSHPRRHLIFQEIIHGGALGPKGEDTSFDMLLHALQLARDFPDRVHFLLSNHDLAQIHGVSIMKDGYDLTERFGRYFELRFGSAAINVARAYRELVLSFPLAGITATGIFFSHSLPAQRDLPTFDQTILRRRLIDADFRRNGSVYQLVWGRFQNQDTLQQLSKMWWADIFVCGHQPQDTGWGILGDRLLVLDCSHNHGAVMLLDLSRQYIVDDLKALIKPIASIA